MAKRRPKTRHRMHSNPRGILKTAADGFGFVHTAEGEYFVPASKMGGAFDGDMVELIPIKVNHSHTQNHKQFNRPGEKPTARVVRVLMRAHETLVGRYEIAEPFGVVVPEDSHIPYDVFTMRSAHPEVEDGDIVRVRLVEYPSRNTAATGVIEEVLGHSDDVGVDIEMIIAHHKLETRFSAASLAQAQRARVDADEALTEGYKDIRDRFVFSIDPVDARDFDDALSLDVMDDGLMRLGVHIADVSHYVPWDSSIDLDARRRATSVYLVDRVIPMLPAQLCEDVCSLVPGTPRRSLSVDIYLDDAFAIRKVAFYQGIIESKARLSYDQAQKILDAAHRGCPSDQAYDEMGECPRPAQSIDIDHKAFATLYDILPRLHRIARARTDQRRAAGGMDFDTVEAKVMLDDQGKPIDVVLRSTTAATSCVEEAMIMANETVATYLNRKGAPCIYRTHEAPAADALAELVPILQEFGYDQHIDLAAFVAGSSSALQQVLQRSRTRAEGPLISNLLLRSMKRAVYLDHCEPHYGLASTCYCHFTSPIRRYPDLVVHRMVKATIGGKSSTYQQQKDSLAWLAEHSGSMERIAEAAARESQETKLVELMQSHLGESFEGIVSGVATYGLYVRLSNTAEGILPIRCLADDYYAYDAAAHTLTGQDNGAVYRLGQPIDVVLTEAVPQQRRMAFRLAGSTAAVR